MVKNIIFDVGKVLVYFEPDWLLDSLNLNEMTKQVLGKAVFYNPVWLECDRGILSKEELLDAFIANAPDYEKEIRVIYEKLGQVIELMPHSLDWIKSLKARGYHLYVISNYGEHLFEKTKHKMEFLPYLDGFIFSYEHCVIKPDTEIYEILLNKYQLVASECVMIDDMQENIEGAKKAGMNAIQFLNPEQAKGDLEELLQQNTEEKVEEKNG